MIMEGNKRPRVHLTGLKNDEKTEFKRVIDQLGGTVDEHLTVYTKVLVCMNSDNRKSRHAHDLQIEVVTVDWIKESFALGRFAEMERFRLGPLEGVRIGVVGYRKEDYVEIVGFA